MRAAVYARVSTEEQTKGYSIENQLDELRSYCQRQGHSLTEHHTFIASGESGASLGPTLRRLLSCAKRSEFDILAVTNVDRFSRNPRLAFNVLYELEECGIGFVCTDEGIDYGTDDGKVETTDRLADSFKERMRFLKRSRKGMERAVKNGRYCGGSIPYGYRLNHQTKRLEVDEQEARIVRLVFDWCVQEGLSTVKIAQRLNGLGVPTRYDRHGQAGRRSKEHAAQLWRYSRIGKMLKNTDYYGEFWFGKRGRKREDWIRGEIPAIISKALYDKAQARLAANRCRPLQNTRREYLLRGLMKCELCGYNYVGTAYRLADGTERRRYRCDARHAYRKLHIEKCPNLPVDADQLERVVWDDIREFVTQPGVILSQLDTMREPFAEQLDEQLVYVESQLRDRDKAEEKLLRLYANDGVTQSILDSTLDDINRERDSLRQYLDRLNREREQGIAFNQQLADAQHTLVALQDHIEGASFEEKRNAVEKLVRGITVKPMHLGGELEPALTVTYRFSEVTGQALPIVYTLPAPKREGLSLHDTLPTRPAPPRVRLR